MVLRAELGLVSLVANFSAVDNVDMIGGHGKNRRGKELPEPSWPTCIATPSATWLLLVRCDEV